MSAIDGYIGWFLGGVDGFMYTLIIFVVIDYVTGLVVAVQLEMERRRAFAEKYNISKLDYATVDNPSAGRVIDPVGVV